MKLYDLIQKKIIQQEALEQERQIQIAKERKEEEKVFFLHHLSAQLSCFSLNLPEPTCEENEKHPNGRWFVRVDQEIEFSKGSGCGVRVRFLPTVCRYGCHTQFTDTQDLFALMETHMRYPDHAPTSTIGIITES